MEIYCETHIPTQQTGAQTPPRVQKPHGNDEWQKNSVQPPLKGSPAPFGVGDLNVRRPSFVEGVSRFSAYFPHGKKMVISFFYYAGAQARERRIPFSHWFNRKPQGRQCRRTQPRQAPPARNGTPL